MVGFSTNRGTHPKPAGRGKSGATFGLTFALVVLVLGGLLFWAFKRWAPLFTGGGGSSNPNAVSENDPRMARAEAEARRTWGDFLALYGHRQFGQQFFVKAKFSEGRATEPLWVQVELLDGIKGDSIAGTIDSPSTKLVTVHPGSPVTVKRENVVDWLFVNGPDRRGGFTIEVMNAVEQERRKSTPPPPPPAAAPVKPPATAPSTLPSTQPVA